MLRVSVVNPFPFLPGNVPIFPGEEELRLQLWNVCFFQPVKTRHHSLMLMDSCRCNLQHGCHICDIWASSSVPNLSPVQFAPVPPILPSGHPRLHVLTAGLPSSQAAGSWLEASTNPHHRPDTVGQSSSQKTSSVPQLGLRSQGRED